MTPLERRAVSGLVAIAGQFSGEATSHSREAQSFRSHRHNGQRVANEYTMRPKATHSVFEQVLISASKPSRKMELNLQLHFIFLENQK